MQPIFFSFVSGLRYRKTVKLYFRRISMFYLVVSIYENTSFRRFLSFLTAGNKSKYGTLHRLTHPQQSTDEPIFRPVSPRKRQAIQGKPLILSPISTQTSSHLRTHGTSVPPAKKIGLQTHLHPRCSQALPNHTPPSPKSHVIPPGPHSSTAQKPRNINDPISNPETYSWELRAKLRSRTTVPGKPRSEAAAGPAGSGRASSRRARPHASDTAPPVWRAPEGPEGTGGLRDRPLRAKLACGDLAGGPPPTGTHSGPAQ